MKKRIIGISVLALAGMVWAAGRPGIVRLKDGTVYDGAIEEVEGGLRINVRGIDTNVPSDRVAGVTYGDFETRWNAEYDKLAKDDATGRIALARLAFDNRKYDFAEKALRDAQAVDPNSAEAADLLKLTISQRRLERNSPAGGGTGPATPQPGTNVQPQAPVSSWKLLAPDQINRIKQVEMRENDDKLRFNFKNGVAKKFVDNDPGLGMKFTEFSRLPKAQQASLIIKNGGELARDVEITNDPDVLLTFRKDVMPLVLQGCATSGCHNGQSEAAGKFALVSPANDHAAVYSNFVVLNSYRQQFRVPAGGESSIFAASTAQMIDRTQPEKSLILQYALPQQGAELKHPVVKNYNGILRGGTNDAKYANIRNFVGALNKTPVDYGFTFELERREPASPGDAPVAPTPRPATRGAGPAGQ
ncbi:MAG TPA: hypothetical protein VF624_15840 [Tepidisphaeraceae bacterium]|jgi:hypothetical protein